MILTKRHLRLLLTLYQRNLEGFEPLEVLDDDADIDYFVQLRYMGLVRKDESDRYHLTYAGNLIGEAWHEADLTGHLPDWEAWDDDYKWVDSTVLNMLYTARHARGRTNSITEPPLHSRGLARNGMLSPLGHKVYEAYEEARPALEVTPAMQAVLKQLPAGPSPKRNLVAADIDKHVLLDLEAQRLIAFSAPAGAYYNLTGLGQQLQAALRTGAFTDTLTPEMLQAVRSIASGESIDEALHVRLVAQAVVSDDGRLLPAGKHLAAASRIYFDGYITEPFSIDIDEVELATLQAIADLEDKFQANPQEAPTKERIRREVIDRQVKHVQRLLDKYGRRLHELPHLKQRLLEGFQEIKSREEWFNHYYDFDTALFGLQSYGLVRPRLASDGTLYYELTSAGRDVLAEQAHHPREIPAEAVKAITLSRLGMFAPDGRWMDKAHQAALIDNAPTPSGRFYARLAYARKTLNLSAYGLEILRKIPYTTGVYLEDLRQWLPQFEEEQLIQLLEKLDARGMIHLYPNDMVKLTPVGRLVKQATAGLAGRFKYPVTPDIIEVLRKLKEVGTLYVKERKVRILPENWKQALKKLEMDEATFQDTLEMLHHARYISKTGITEAGLLLLEADEQMHQIVNQWEEIEA